MIRFYFGLHPTKIIKDKPKCRLLGNVIVHSKGLKEAYREGGSLILDGWSNFADVNHELQQVYTAYIFEQTSQYSTLKHTLCHIVPQA